MTPADVAAKYAPLLHIHGKDPGDLTFACGDAADYKTPGQGREARPGELITCDECKRLLVRIRCDYTYTGRRRAVAITGDTHS